MRALVTTISKGGPLLPPCGTQMRSQMESSSSSPNLVATALGSSTLIFEISHFPLVRRGRKSRTVNQVGEYLKREFCRSDLWAWYLHAWSFRWQPFAI